MSSRSERRRRPEPIGAPLLPVPDDGRLAFSPLEQSVREQIQILLLTRPGELLLHPAFGVGLEDWLHKPNTVETRRRIHDAITDGIARYERRIRLDRVEVTEVEGHPDRLKIALAWRLARTGLPGGLQLSLRLEG